MRTRGAPFSCRAFPPEKEEEKKKKSEKATFLVFEEDKKDDEEDPNGRDDARALFIIDVMIRTDTDAMIARFFFSLSLSLSLSLVCVCVCKCVCIFCSQENKGRKEEEREAGQNPKVPARKKRYAKHHLTGRAKPSLQKRTRHINTTSL